MGEGRSRLAKSLPWWAVLVVGAVCVLIGAVLVARPFTSLSVLVWCTAASLAVTGIGEWLSADRSPRPWLSRLIGIALVAIAAVVVLWPDITIFALAIVVGVALIARGFTKIIDAALADDDRWTGLLTGLTNALCGLIALSWPAVTVLVLAVVFGLSTAVFGVRLVALGWQLRTDPTGAAAVQSRSPRSKAIRLIGASLAFLAAVGATAVSVAVHRAQPDEPGSFYDVPSPLPDGPMGTIVRQEVVDDYQPGATTYRVMYLSTGFDGRPTAVSGLIIVPDAPAPAEGRKVLGYAHGTVGVARRCGPSFQGDHWADFMRMEGLSDFIDAGYVVAATDYQGLGTTGPHPYLVGASEGMNELDAVRAAMSMPEAGAGDDVAIWGHSQGGHAALFSGQIAPDYAPELHIVGVAAGAPAPDLVEMFKANLDSTVGKVLISMALQSWAQVYDDASLDQIVTPAARPIVRRLAKNCIFTTGQIIGSLPSSLALGITFLSNPPWETEPWKTIVQSNNPGQVALGVPVLLTQGAADVLIPPVVTEQLLQRMCANGDHVQLEMLPGIGHLDGGPAAVPDVAAWIADRFAGAAPTVDDCANAPPGSAPG
jgi:uncharacterized membrane protein HdeD (DUF308 family)/pimeloyl-ACP methyl ester carboxylesterase